MTNQTLAQDPAEFRRKFKGLRQLYLRSHAVYSPGGTRAGEAVSAAVTGAAPVASPTAPSRLLDGQGSRSLSRMARHTSVRPSVSAQRSI
jgi:hypothetical protein